MREARIIVPVHDNKGDPLSALRTLVQKNLLTMFGGFTEALSTGGWEDPTGKAVIEPVYVYDVAIFDESDHERLDRFANIIRIAASQDAIYVRHGDGNVVMIR